MMKQKSSDISGSVNPRGDLGSLRPPVSKDSLISKYDSIYWDEEMYAMMYGAHRIDCCGDIIYENLKPTPNRILFNGSYVTFSNKQPLYHFYLTDHQGNVRVVADGNGAVEQINHYYLFGALFGEIRGDDGQRYRYNGKELERLLALDWYDYGARWYDPVLGIWHSIDPLAGKYPSVSPYVYCLNNPMNAIDPDGMDWYQDTDKTWQYSPDVHSQKDLAKGQVYKGRSFSTGKGSNLVQYRSDGSILYTNETAAYNRMWNQADVHYRKMGEKGGREVGGFILSNGKVLVLPNYKNDKRTSDISGYGYQLNTNGTMTKGKETFNVLANIHTHQDKSGDPNPSYVGYKGKYDGSISEKIGKPVFTMGHDNNVWVIIQNKNKQAVTKLPFKVSYLLRNNSSFVKYVKYNNWNLK